MDKLNAVRRSFPHINERILYMNHAAIAPISREVKEAIHEYMEERSVTNIENYFSFQLIIEETLSLIANIISAEPHQIEFAPNTSYGLNVLVQGLEWKKGDQVILPGCEFPANVYPFMSLARKGVDIKFVPHDQGVFTIEDIERLITKRTRLISVSWVQFLSGYTCDLERLGSLCREQDILFCVDAIQGMGALQLDVKKMSIDFLSTGGHKWLMASQGIGFIYVSESLLSKLQPVVGWLNGDIDWDNLMAYELTFHPDARKFRPGTLNCMGITALHASLKRYVATGPAWCEEQLLNVNRSLRSVLASAGFSFYGAYAPEHNSGIISCNHPESQKLFEALQENQIYTALRNGLLRFSPGYYTSDADLDRLERVLNSIE